MFLFFFKKKEKDNLTLNGLLHFYNLEDRVNLKIYERKN